MPMEREYICEHARSTMVTFTTIFNCYHFHQLSAPQGVGGFNLSKMRTKRHGEGFLDFVDDSCGGMNLFTVVLLVWDVRRVGRTGASQTY